MPKLKNLLKKLVLSCLVFVLLASIFVPTAFAQQGVWYNQSYQDWHAKVFDKSNPSDIFGERYTAAQVQWVIYGFWAFLLNSVTNEEAVSCVIIHQGENLNECSDMVMGMLSSVPQSNYGQENEGKSFLATVFEERPFSGLGYLKDIGRKFNLIPEARAQGVGFGFQALDPILHMWQASRNIAYALFVIATVIIAFMIMFRVKISPQVVITVQSALPKIAIAIILVTFSYAIAGFMVDLMYVVIGLVSLLGSSFFPFEFPPNATFNLLTKGHVLNWNVQLGAFGLVFVYMILFPLAFFIINYQTLGVFLGAAGALIGTIFIIIALLILLWMFIKIVWMLLKAYVNVLLLTIFAPFMIAAGILIPSIGFGSWLKNLASNLAVFVATGALFLLSIIFLLQGVRMSFNLFMEGNFGDTFLNAMFGTAIREGFGSIGSNTASWPPLLGIGEAGIPFLFLGASFVIFTLIPKAADIIKGMIEGKPFTYGTAIGESVGLPVTASRAGLAWYAGKTEEKGMDAARSTTSPYIPDKWISALRTAGIIKK